ncbi:hypothetical protein RHA1_ro10396 (plasmid) [Rhodococcus jostii RHA1]|uniref:DUF3263 domain-containing protein n=1 Tax=Rhodococcus jostii (strain RHA1) TaxID=101510 RepID=Q0RVV1_RHOJR|nr:hypothetical protein RHA1_ro10396 [Rhodococcus jostii RHA1]
MPSPMRHRPTDPHLEDQLTKYRQRRHRQLIERRVRAKLHHTPDEASEIIQFALTWSPYGGAPDDEIFVRFGMTRERFAQCLGDILHDRSLATGSHQLPPSRRHR